MLGSVLFKELSRDHIVFGTGKSKINNWEKYKCFDLLNENYKELIDWSNPDLIIHCAALTNSKYCNDNPKEAYLINGLSIKKFLNATNGSVKIIYISTDAVFPSVTHMAKEQDIKIPENIYGKSKELGEFFLLNSNRKSLIIRTTIVGQNKLYKGNSLVEWILNSIKNNEEVVLFNDVLFTPISIWDLSKEISFLLSHNKFRSQILHISGTEIISKYTFGVALSNSIFSNSDNIIEGKISNFKDRVNRSQNQTLNCSKYQKEFKRKLPNLTSTIKNLSQNLEL